MGRTCGEDGQDGGFYQPYVMPEIRFSITKDNISKIQMSLCIAESNMIYIDDQ